MKKILSVMLAIMMLFSTMVLGTSALNIGGKELAGNQAVVILYFGNGYSESSLFVYDSSSNSFNLTSNVTGTYYYLPGNGTSCNDMKAGDRVYLPRVISNDATKVCDGWELLEGTINGQEKFVVGDFIKLPDDCGGKVYEFQAIYGNTVPEEDTMATVLAVLMKVFGTIVGILFLDGNSAAGVELMQGVLGGLLG